MKTTQTFSILIWANKSKAIDNEAPLFVRITVDAKRAEVSLKKRIELSKWDASKGCMKGTSEDVRTINNYINQVKSEIFKLYTHMQMLDEFITADAIKNWFLGQKEEKKTILIVFDYHNEQMEKMVGIDVVRATLVKFRTIRTKLASYIKYQYKRSDIYLEQLNHQFITNFEYYLKTEEHIQHNTTMKYIQNLKKIINLAVRNGWLLHSPFKEFHCSFKKVERNVLTMDEIQILENRTFKFERLQQVCDLFIFSCYTGLAYIDVMRLTHDNMSIGIDGSYWLFTERKKTGEKVRIPLLSQALIIIEKYKNHPAVISKDGLLPHLSNQKLNSYLKEIADLCSIEKNLTFHLARHTFATTITLSNGVPIETVSKLLGHSSIKTTQIYAKVIERKVCEDMQLLRTRLEQKPKPKRLKAI